MVANAHDSDEDARPAKLEKPDITVLLGTAATIFALPLILIFAHGERSATLGILWGWTVQISIWVYVILLAN